MTKHLNKKNFYLLIALFIGLLFAFITYKTPLAGDDWGYALNGMKGNPIEMAFSFYNSWSGRFFSELWGFVVAPRKWLWNILNPLLFVTIFICSFKLMRTKNKFVLVPIFILACMLSVDDHLRMETYSWIMGTTYVVPLCFSLLYFVFVDHLFKANLLTNQIKALSLLSNLLLFVIGLMMENIAGAMIGAISILIIYSYFNRRKITKYLVVNLVVSTVAFMLMRLSPGSTYRLMRDSAEWAALPFVDKIIGAYPSFIQNTFINNNYLILFFSITMILLLISSKKKNTSYKVFSILIQLLAIVSAFSFVVPQLTFMQNPNSIYSMVFWPIYTVLAITNIWLFIENAYRRDKIIFFIVVGGGSSLAMLFSPIYGVRSALYVVYFLIIAAALILEEIPLQKYIAAGLMVIFAVVIFDRTNEFINKYQLVGLAQEERLQIIEYYKNNPDVEEAWIPKFPIYTVHGVDIEPEDTYHLEVFKTYFELPQDYNKIIFYYKD